MRARARRRRDRGFTLVEVLMAFVLSTVGLLGALMLSLSLITGSSFSRHMTEASSLAQSKLEAIESQNLAVNPPADGPVTPSESLDAYGNVVSSSGTISNGTVPTTVFTRSTTWATVANNGTNMRLITVTVSWPDAAGLTHNVVATEERIP